MKNHIAKFYFFIILCVYCNSCKLSYDTIDVTKIIESYNYIDLTDTFQVKIIRCLSCSPIDRTIVSQLIGVKENNDTIRVMFINNDDYICEENDIVWVMPKQKPDFQVTTCICIDYKNKKRWEICEWQIENFKTIFGKIMK